jgi:hypothetical protein
MAKKLSPLEQKSSKTVLDALRKETSGMLSGKMDGLKKVTVASDSPSGLAKGLELAKKLQGVKGEREDATHSDVLCPVCGSEPCECADEESPEEDAGETQQHEDAENDENADLHNSSMSTEDIDAEIRRLQALKFKQK